LRQAGQPRVSSMRGRKRRGSDSHMRHVLDGTVVIAAAPERRPVGVSGREGDQRLRPHKLTIEERDAIHLDANSGRSLRSLAAVFGVSHGTIRAVLRDQRPAAKGETLNPRLAPCCRSQCLMEPSPLTGTDIGPKR
jgi:hypothetical protein